MHHIEHAGHALAGSPCDVCPCDIEADDQVVYDADVTGDGDDARVVLTMLRHASCDKAVQKAKDEARAAAYLEASNIVKYVPKDEAILALQTRADQARRHVRSARHSGCDVDAALFSGLRRQ